MSKKGRKHEHDLVNGLATVTPDEVWVSTTGYSGNDATAACDFVITVDPYLLTTHENGQYNVEAKITSGDRGKRISTVFSGGRGGETGIEELRRLVQTTPGWAHPVVTISIDHCKLFVLDARNVLYELDEHPDQYPQRQLDALNVLQPRCTPSDNVSVVKPSLDDWASSAVSPADEVVLAKALGLPLVEDTYND